MKRSVSGIAALVAITMSMLGGSLSAQEKTALVSERDKVSYAVGVDVASSFEPVGPFIDLAAFEKALKNAFSGGQPLISEDEARQTDQALRVNIAASQGQPIPGMPPGSTPPPVDKSKVGLMLGGFVVGQALAPMKDDIDVAVLMQAMRTALGKTGTPLLTVEQAQAEMQAFMTRQQGQAGAKNRAEGISFLAENKTRKGVITTPTGLQYMVLREGNGARPLPSSRVRVNYVGTLLNGTKFDSSYDRGQPAEFGLNQVIPGWTEGVSLMPVGAKYRFWIPSELAYGPNGAPGGVIGPDATLTFDVELMGILQ
ncbi:FKBP-type peptidyl-prolyl cis-trans isomerase N-terminal domain-containing protein [Pseudoxanthomonas wuyuanensis]|uniref:Peptidyl-prolyl cis-trans isomerase n=1 Tax=Pseudoxanthomonas wuyuanensis TaxID=1073196 RepID=A0A286CXR7_9GAMM|nr:peptidylprolyl isomerase [Pseudoxanthomonas wuyuanensis]SOD51180.1 FKBP-type peptidyl-prolyl cis-trans isomerase FkpA [Pseudoxanthomonas wuyuanensis]